MPRAFVLSLMGLVVMSVAFLAFTATPPVHAIEVGAAEPEKPSTFAAAAATFEVYKDKSGEYRWRLRATNTQILAMAAQGYSDKRSCLNAIESVKRDVASAPVKEEEAVAGKDDASADGAAAKTAGSRSRDGSTSGSTSGTTSGSKSGSTSGTNSGTTGSKTSQK